jgi:hypothetical protein
MSGISKAIAVGAALVSISAISKNSSLLGLAEAKAKQGEFMTDEFLKHNSGDADVLKEGVKKWYWNTLLDDKYMETYYKIKNVAHQAVKQTSNYGIPLILSAGAWFGGPVAPICAGLLLLLGAKFVITEVMGVGKKEK